MIQSVNLPPCAHTITSSAHYSTLQPSAACSQPSSVHPVHTLQQPLHIQYTLQPIFSAHYSTLQPSAACSQPSSAHTAAAITYSVHTAANLQCTLQLYYPVHTAATLSGANTIQCIQCTSGPPQGKPIPLLAYLQSSQQTLMVDCSSP